MSLVSVVIPTCDRAHLLEDALASAAAQTWRALEIIVVDDGSTDDTRAVVERFRAGADRPVRYLRQACSGANAARNRGIRASRGKVVAFLDSDDLWDSAKIARQMAVLETEPGCGAVYCGLVESVVGTDRHRPPTPRRWPRGDLSRALLVADETAPTSAWIARRDLLLRCGLFDTTLEARQDWDMWIRLSQVTRIGTVPAPLMTLRHHDGPRTVSDPTREMRAHRAILRKYAAERRRAGLPTRLAARAAYHRRAGRVALHYRRRPLPALAHQLAALFLWPTDPGTYAALAGILLPAALRRRLRRTWNARLGATRLGIRSH